MSDPDIISSLRDLCRRHPTIASGLAAAKHRLIAFDSPLTSQEAIAAIDALSTAIDLAVAASGLASGPESSLRLVTFDDACGSAIKQLERAREILRNVAEAQGVRFVGIDTQATRR